MKTCSTCKESKAFDLTDIDEVRACWSLGNLRLLRARDNLAKADRIEVLL